MRNTEKVILGSTSLWQAELKGLDLPFVTGPLQGTLDTDVAIIGAGITGTATVALN